MGFYRQEYWSGLSFPSPGDLPKSGIEPRVSRIASRCFTIWATRENLRYPYGKAFQNYSNKPVLSCSLCCILLLPLKPQSKKNKQKKPNTIKVGLRLSPHSYLVPLNQNPMLSLPVCHAVTLLWDLCVSSTFLQVLFSFPSVAAPTLPYVPNIYILRTLQAWRRGARGRNGEKGGRMSNSPQWVLKTQIIYFQKKSSC